MFQTQANSPITFPFYISMQAKIIPTSSCSEKSGKTGKNAPSVTGGQRAVTFCAGVIFVMTVPETIMVERIPYSNIGLTHCL